MALLNETQFSRIAKLKQNEEEYLTIIIENINLSKLLFKKCRFNNLECISFKNNNFQDLSFLPYFPNLWHLEMRGNPLTKFDDLNGRTFGYFSLSLDRYSLASFSQVKKANFIILVTDGIQDTSLKTSLYPYNSIKIIVLNKEYLYTDNIFTARRSTNYNYLNLNLKSENVENDFEKVEKFVRSEIEHSDIVDLFDFLEKEKHNKERNSVYIERKKIETYFRTYNKYQKLCSLKDQIGIGNPNFKFNLIDFSILIVKDRVIQFYILDIMILYIHFLIPKILAAKLLATICEIYTGEKVDLDVYLNVLGVTKPLLIGYLSEIFDNFKELNSRLNPNITTPGLDPDIDLMKFEVIIFKIKFLDFIEENYVESFHNKSTSYNQRLYSLKTEILTTLKVTGDQFTNLLKLSQALQDFIIYKYIDKSLTGNFYGAYIIYQGIRAACFEVLKSFNKQSLEDVCDDESEGEVEDNVALFEKRYTEFTNENLQDSLHIKAMKPKMEKSNETSEYSYTKIKNTSDLNIMERITEEIDNSESKYKKKSKSKDFNLIKLRTNKFNELKTNSSDLFSSSNLILQNSLPNAIKEICLFNLKFNKPYQKFRIKDPQRYNALQSFLNSSNSTEEEKQRMISETSLLKFASLKKHLEKSNQEISKRYSLFKDLPQTYRTDIVNHTSVTFSKKHFQFDKYYSNCSSEISSEDHIKKIKRKIYLKKVFEDNKEVFNKNNFVISDQSSIHLNVPLFQEGEPGSLIKNEAKNGTDNEVQNLLTSRTEMSAIENTLKEISHKDKNKQEDETTPVNENTKIKIKINFRKNKTRNHKESNLLDSSPQSSFNPNTEAKETIGNFCNDTNSSKIQTNMTTTNVNEITKKNQFFITSNSNSYAPNTNLHSQNRSQNLTQINSKLDVAPNLTGNTSKIINTPNSKKFNNSNSSKVFTNLLTPSKKTDPSLLKIKINSQKVRFLAKKFLEKSKEDSVIIKEYR